MASSRLRPFLALPLTLWLADFAEAMLRLIETADKDGQLAEGLLK